MIPTTPENTMSETKTPLCELCGKRASIVKVGTPGMFACGSCMPADVRTVVEDVRRNKQYGILPGPSGNAVRWLAADRERLLARVAELERQRKQSWQDYSDARRVNASR